MEPPERNPTKPAKGYEHLFPDIDPATGNAKIAEVKTIYPVNFRDIVVQLRMMADKIEAGEYVAEDAVFVMQTDRAVEVFGWGKAVMPTSIGLLELGKAKMCRVWEQSEKDVA